MLGLLKLGDTDKKEHEMIWDVILDDKLSRQCNSTTMSYFMKLQEQTSEDACSKTQKDTVFLNSQDLINHHPSKVSSTPTPPEVATSPDSNNPGYNKKPLPINLSTLLPVSKNSLTNVVECMQKPTWLQSGTLNIPGLSSVLNKSLVTSTPLPEAPTITWPGIEVIRDAYMKYHEGNTYQPIHQSIYFRTNEISFSRHFTITTQVKGDSIQTARRNESKTCHNRSLVNANGFISQSS